MSGTAFNFLEWYILTSLGYPLLSAAYAHYMKPKVEKEIVEYDGTTNGISVMREVTTSNTSMPVFANIGNVSVPIGGGHTTHSKEWETMITSFIIEKSPGQKKILINAKPNAIPKKEVDMRTEYPDSYLHGSWKNSIGENITHEPSLYKIFDEYEIRGKFPIVFPMRIDYYKIKAPQIYHHPPTGYLHSVRNALVKDTLFRKRLPGTIGIPLFAIGIWGTVTVLHALYDTSNQYYYDRPLTDIMGKITGNTYRKQWEARTGRRVDY